MLTPKFFFKTLAPYLAVGLFWCFLRNAWLAILAYHLQALCWTRLQRAPFSISWNPRLLFLISPTLLAGPVAYFLLPHVTEVNIAQWITHYNLTPLSLGLLIPYFGIIHPFIEQNHWAPLRQQSALAHFAFAGYHVVVLHALFAWPWLLVIFILLSAVSFLWMKLEEQAETLLIPTLSHILADTGIVLAAYFLCYP